MSNPEDNAKQESVHLGHGENEGEFKLIKRKDGKLFVVLIDYGDDVKKPKVVRREISFAELRAISISSNRMKKSFKTK